MNLLKTQTMQLKACLCFCLLVCSTQLNAQEAPAPPVGMSDVSSCIATQDCTSCVTDINYWVVSTRCCGQKGKRCCPCCEFDIYHSSEAGRVTESSYENLVQSLDPNAPICIMVHGSFVDWEGALTDSYNTFFWIRNAAPHRPLNMIFFTWPSDEMITKVLPLLDVNILGKRAGYNGHYLAKFISQIPGHHKISLLGHSHGARIVSSALHLIGGGSVQGISLNECGIHIACDCHRFRAVFAAAAINHNWLNPGKRYGCSLNCTECVVNLRNRRDRVLFFYPLSRLIPSRALARSGFTYLDRRALGNRRGCVQDIEVSKCVGVGHMFPNYYTHPEIAAAIAPTLYFD